MYIPGPTKVKESENLSGKNNEGSEMKSEANTMGKELNDFSDTKLNY